MAEIRGKYVYDDDFTPGRKNDGGLSQNLYNDEGRVETHATFIPDDEYEYEPDSEPQGLSDEDRRRAEELGALLGAALVAIAIAAAPHVKRWWLDTAWPGLKKLVARKPKAVAARDESAALALTALSKAEPADDRNRTRHRRHPHRDEQRGGTAAPVGDARSVSVHRGAAASPLQRAT